MSEYWGEYLVTYGALLLIYIAFRISIWDDRRLPKSKRDNRSGSAIDASPLAKRLAEVKGGYASEVLADHSGFKKPLLVEQRRQEIAQLPYFQKPVEPEEPERHDGLTMIMV